MGGDRQYGVGRRLGHAQAGRERQKAILLARVRRRLPLGFVDVGNHAPNDFRPHATVASSAMLFQTIRRRVGAKPGDDVRLPLRSGQVLWA
jgi:hypothetical protein